MRCSFLARCREGTFISEKILLSVSRLEVIEDARAEFDGGLAQLVWRPTCAPAVAGSTPAETALPSQEDGIAAVIYAFFSG